METNKISPYIENGLGADSYSPRMSPTSEDRYLAPKSHILYFLHPYNSLLSTPKVKTFLAKHLPSRLLIWLHSPVGSEVILLLKCITLIGSESATK